MVLGSPIPGIKFFPGAAIIFTITYSAILHLPDRYPSKDIADFCLPYSIERAIHGFFGGLILYFVSYCQVYLLLQFRTCF